MRILFATSNDHKVREVRQILTAAEVEVVTLGSLGALPAEPVEDGATFLANARIKALGYARATGQRCLAEDSGLEVDALGGAPGVHSARYASMSAAEVPRDRDARDAANNAKLMRALADVPDGERSARFVCAMCLADPQDGVLFETRGTFEGVIASEPHGAGGFGYDPLLWLPDVSCTSAELTPEAKNARSHRGQACKRLLAWLLENR